MTDEQEATAKLPPLTPEERRDGLLEVLALEVRALTLAVMTSPPEVHPDYEAEGGRLIAEAHNRADDIICATYTKVPWPEAPTPRAS